MVECDLLIKGARVLDPGRNIDGIMDVALAGGRIVALENGIPGSGAGQVIDAAGKLVTPGLIDLHTHLYWGQTAIGLEPDPVCARSGVTTVVDAGSADVKSFAGFRRFICEPAQSRVFAFLHATPYPRPGIDPIAHARANAAATASMVEENRDVILGLKLFVAGNMVGEYGLGLLEVAREICDRIELPIMVHIGFAPPSIPEILSLLVEGDIVTHSFNGHENRVVDEVGKVREDILEARERGVLLDIGHGSGSFSFATARAMLAQNQLPDVISTDLYAANADGPVYDLPTTLSKFLALGMSLEEVIVRATEAPAAVIGKGDGMGRLEVGGAGDVSILEVLDGAFELTDCHRETITAGQRLISAGAIRAGRLMEVGDGESV